MMNKKLQWRKVSQKISPSGLLVYLLLQEEGKVALSPTFVEKTGLMTKGTASKAITELKRNGLLTEEGELIYLEEDVDCAGPLPASTNPPCPTSTNTARAQNLKKIKIHSIIYM